MWREAKAEIAFEFSQLHQLLDTYRPLLTKLSTVEPDRVESIAVGGILQSFYNGVENIFRRIALESGGILTGPTWHRDLLEAMAHPETSRKAVISEVLRDRLREYLSVSTCLPVLLYLLASMGQDVCCGATARRYAPAYGDGC